MSDTLKLPGATTYYEMQGSDKLKAESQTHSRALLPLAFLRSCFPILLSSSVVEAGKGRGRGELAEHSEFNGPSIDPKVPHVPSVPLTISPPADRSKAPGSSARLS